MSKVWDWFTSKERTLTKYEEAKKEFTKIMGRPVIMIPVELPEELADLKEEFLDLENDDELLKTINKVCLEYLKKKNASKPST